MKFIFLFIVISIASTKSYSSNTIKDSLILSKYEQSVKRGIELSDEQAVDFFLLERQRVSALKEMLKSNKTLVNSLVRIQQMNDDHYKKLAKVLSPEQYRRYLQLEGAKQRAMEKHGKDRIDKSIDNIKRSRNESN